LTAGRYHAWESKARSYLTVLDPSTIRDIDTSFTRMARKFREPEEERRWLAAGKVDGAGSGTGFGEGDEEGEKEETGSPLRFVRRLPDR